jgi:hypothetical protein
MGACSNSNEELPLFEDYYKQFGNLNGEHNPELERDTSIYSDWFTIDTILRSMKGDVQEIDVELAELDDIIWITGYELEVLDSNGKAKGGEYMCHNNLNLSSLDQFKWNHSNYYNNNRVFTLTQGIQNTHLPRGYGIPFSGNQKFRVVFQSLNHNLYPVNMKLRHRVTIYYYLQSEIDFNLHALTHKTIWVMKQFKGPAGELHSPPEAGLPKHDIPSCGIEGLANDQNKTFDIFWDDYGRKYTGHWKLPPGKEFVEFDVTRQLGLNRDVKAHYLSAHAHPFCDSLVLVDKTTNTPVWVSKTASFQNGIGLTKIGSLTSKEGITLLSGHNYALRSYYNNTSTDTLSAMSAMYVFVR